MYMTCHSSMHPSIVNQSFYSGIVVRADEQFEGGHHAEVEADERGREADEAQERLVVRDGIGGERG